MYATGNSNFLNTHLIFYWSVAQLSQGIHRRHKWGGRQRAIRLNDLWLLLLLVLWYNYLAKALLRQRCLLLSISLSECRILECSLMAWSTLHKINDSLCFIGFVWLRDILIKRDGLFSKPQLPILSRFETLDSDVSLMLVFLFIVQVLIKPPRNRVTLRNFIGAENIPFELWVRKNFGHADRLLLFRVLISSSRLIVPKKLISFRIDGWWGCSMKLLLFGYFANIRRMLFYGVAKYFFKYTLLLLTNVLSLSMYSIVQS